MKSDECEFSRPRSLTAIIGNKENTRRKCGAPTEGRDLVGSVEPTESSSHALTRGSVEDRIHKVCVRGHAHPRHNQRGTLSCELTMAPKY